MVEFDADNGVRAELCGLRLQRPKRSILAAHRFVRIDDANDLCRSIDAPLKNEHV